MAKISPNSFITEMRLIVDSKKDKELLALFQAGRQLNNACLGEIITRLELVGNSSAYQQANKDTQR